MMSSDKKVALITGSTSGIGLAIAEELAKRGINIVLNGFVESTDTKDALLKKISDYGAKVIYSDTDLTNISQIDKMFEVITNELGAPDILINNAGMQHVCPIEEFPIEKWTKIIDLNLVAAFHTIRNVIPSMKHKKFGRIINVASAHGLVASPFKSAYVASKHAIVGLSKTVALEVGEFGITVNAVCPGYVDTPLVRKQVADTAKVRGISEDDVIRKVMLEPHATKQFINTFEIAALVAFLCSDEAKSITGTAIPIDAGWTAK